MTTVSPTLQARLQLDRQLVYLSAIDAAVDVIGSEGISPFSYGSFRYLEPAELKAASDEDRRKAALAWVARHARIIEQVASEHDLEVKSFDVDGEFGVEAVGEIEGRFFVFGARVTTAPGLTGAVEVES